MKNKKQKFAAMGLDENGVVYLDGVELFDKLFSDYLCSNKYTAFDCMHDDHDLVDGLISAITDSKKDNDPLSVISTLEVLLLVYSRMPINDKIQFIGRLSKIAVDVVDYDSIFADHFVEYLDKHPDMLMSYLMHNNESDELIKKINKKKHKDSCLTDMNNLFATRTATNSVSARLEETFKSPSVYLIPKSKFLMSVDTSEKSITFTPALVSHMKLVALHEYQNCINYLADMKVRSVGPTPENGYESAIDGWKDEAANGVDILPIHPNEGLYLSFGILASSNWTGVIFTVDATKDGGSELFKVSILPNGVGIIRGDEAEEIIKAYPSYSLDGTYLVQNISDSRVYSCVKNTTGTLALCMPIKGSDNDP